MGRIVSNADKAKRAVRERLEAGLEFVAIRAKELHKADLGRQYPPASTPNEFPARRTGNLQDSTDHALDAAELQSAMGYRKGVAPYWMYLIRSGRLGPAETVQQHLPELQQAFIAGVKSVGDFK